MSRIKLSLPESLPYCTAISVQVGDLNYGNHLANDAVLKLAHEARVRWLADGGFSELDVGGCGLIMADVAIEYVAQAFYGDVLVFKMEWANAPVQVLLCIISSNARQMSKSSLRSK